MTTSKEPPDYSVFRRKVSRLWRDPMADQPEVVVPVL